MKKHNVLVTVNGISKSRAQWAKELGVTKGAISHRESMGKSASSAISGILGTKHTRKILEHYAHAKKKHPYFCDDLLPELEREEILRITKNVLTSIRKKIEDRARAGHVGWDDLLNCEVWEVFDAIINNDKAQAIEELYDCIAVLLRTVDVLKGWQKLGKPETKGGAE